MQQICPSTKWVEIHLDAIEHNYLQVRQRLDDKTRLLGVVKADAYGHGALEVARVLEKMGVDMLGVTTVEEGCQLRENQISIPILVFAPFLPDEVEKIISYDLTVTVAAKEQIEWLKQALLSNSPDINSPDIKVHLKVETGMGRTGFMPAEITEAAREVLAVPGLILEGVYSHFATAMWKNKRYAKLQLKLFQETLQKLEQAGINELVKHISNSAAILDLPEAQLDMVRTGTLLYGQVPSPRHEGMLELMDPWLFKARIIHLRELPAGYGVGYGRTYKTTRKTMVAILPIGFMDGFQMEPVLKPAGFWELLKGGIKQFLYYINHPLVTPSVLLPGGGARIIGKVGMQLTMINVTGIKGAEIGTEVRIPVRRTAVSLAVPRLYLQDSKLMGIRRSENT
ncbi:MAG: alanine racemase [Firmicutes bacterium HGW-Firmicutes-12]|jgi:alanine racemase|nr:MAG: alanine racemase [Firmicutes bacterium HGW-Firmicutes-12]